MWAGQFCVPPTNASALAAGVAAIKPAVGVNDAAAVVSCCLLSQLLHHQALLPAVAVLAAIGQSEGVARWAQFAGKRQHIAGPGAFDLERPAVTLASGVYHALWTAEGAVIDESVTVPLPTVATPKPSSSWRTMATV